MKAGKGEGNFFRFIQNQKKSHPHGRFNSSTSSPSSSIFNACSEITKPEKVSSRRCPNLQVERSLINCMPRGTL